MNEIIIDGVNLSELKVEYDALAAKQAEVRVSIRQGSSKFLADKTSEVDKLIAELKEVETKEEAENVAKQLIEVLKVVQFVSNVSGVSYSIPYYHRQGDYFPDGTPISYLVENGYIESLDDWDSNSDPIIYQLFSLAEDMESEVCEWNTSYC